MTAAPEWHQALTRSFLSDAGSKVLVSFGADDEIAGLLPVYRQSTRRVFGSTIALLTDLYGGRAAVLARDPSAALSLFDRLADAYPDWSCLKMSLVDGHPDSTIFLDALRPIRPPSNHGPWKPRPISNYQIVSMTTLAP
jgi:hypothetical protein